MQIDNDLKSKLQADPNATVSLIIRTKDNRDEDLEALRARGLKIRHTYSLISAVAVEGPASAALAVARESWIVSMEFDQEVHAL